MAGDFVDQQTQTVEYICLDIDAIARKIVERLPDSQATVFAAGSLAMAVYVLRLAASGQSQGYQPRVPQGYQAQAQQPQQGPAILPMPVVAHNPGSLDVSAIAQQVAERMRLLDQSVDQSQSQAQIQPRNLANTWAGPLPTLHPNPASGSLPRNGVGTATGRSVVREALKVKVVDPTFVCQDCGGTVYDHAKERHAPYDAKGRAVYMLCGNRRVRCEPE
jgi:hypothetical protein